MTTIHSGSVDSTLVDTTDKNVRAWAVLLLAGVFEIAFAVSTSGSQGFTNLNWSIATVIAAALTIVTLSIALKTIDVGLGYAVWTAIGASGAAVFGAIFFGEQLTPLRILWLAVIVLGVVGLKLASSPRLEKSADTPAGNS